MSSQLKAKYCSDAHRIYAWRERQREAAGMPIEGNFVTARVVTK